MRKLALATTAAAFLCATVAVAAPVPSSVSGVGQATSGDIVQVKTKKKRMKKSRAMSRGAQPMTGGMSGGSTGSGASGQPMQGGSAGAGQPGAMPQKTQ